MIKEIIICKTGTTHEQECDQKQNRETVHKEKGVHKIKGGRYF